MSETYKIVLLVEGQDRASGPLGSVKNALGGIGTVAGGILTAGLLYRIGNGLMDMVRSAWDAVGSMQALSISLETLAASELVNTGKAKDFNAALKDASPIAQDLLKWIRDLSLVSPYSYETIAGAYRFNVSFGQSTELAKTSTQAMIDFSAAVGLTGPEFDRLAYALAQTSAAGKITAMDIRQFSNSRFGVQQLNAVFKEMSRTTGVLITDYKDFNAAVEEGKVTTADFFESFSSYVNRAYLGAGERMVKTLPGLASNMADVTFFSLSDAFGKSGQVLVNFLLPYLDKVIGYIKSGKFIEIGDQIAVSFKSGLAVAGNALDLLMVIIQSIASGNTGAAFDALRAAFAGIIPPVVFDLLQKLFASFSQAGLLIQTTILPVLQQVAGWLGVQLLQALTFVNAHFQEFQGAVIAVGIALAATGLVPILTGVAVAIAAINWPIVLLIAGAALLGAAWAGNWGGIQEKTAAVWAWMQPKLQALIVVIKNNLPGAIAALEVRWNNLQAVITVVWGWINANLVPQFVSLVTWLEKNLPIAIAKLMLKWGELQNKFFMAWSWINLHLVPLFKAIGDLLGLTLFTKSDLLAKLWGGALKLAIEYVTFGFENLKKVLDVVGPFLGDLVAGAFKNLTGIIDGVTYAIEKLNDALRTIKLPAWMTPGSPTPWENGLVGVQKALNNVSLLAMPELAASFNAIPAPAMPSLGATGMLQPSYAGAQGGVVVNIYSTLNTADEDKMRRVLDPIIMDAVRKGRK